MTLYCADFISHQLQHGLLNGLNPFPQYIINLYSQCKAKIRVFMYRNIQFSAFVILYNVRISSAFFPVNIVNKHPTMGDFISGGDEGI